MNEPGVFVGRVRHRRFSPASHTFTYRVFMVLVDIDRIDALMSESRLTSRNRWNWASFDDRDHLGDPALPLRERLRQDAARAGIALPDGRVLLLTHLRYLGHCFNPVSFYYAFDAEGGLCHVAAEVNNTFGESHTYWLTREGGADTFRSSASKSLYVSPFMPDDIGYRFALSPPGHRLVVHMDALQGSDTIFDATLTLDRRPWTAGELRRCLLRFPAMTLGVVGAIHWEAVKLWAKGVPVVARVTGEGR